MNKIRGNKKKEINVKLRNAKVTKLFIFAAAVINLYVDTVHGKLKR